MLKELSLIFVCSIKTWGIYHYNVEKLVYKLTEIIKFHVDELSLNWLLQQAALTENVANLTTSFALMPRKTSKKIIHLTPEQDFAIQTIRPHFNINGWSTDRLCRVWLLLQINSSDKVKYIHTIENLFLAAEMQEQVALYSALPVFAYQEDWRKRCAEGIRSNIGDVLLSIMCNNPYPSEQLDNSAWNQMVLKAFFTEKPVHQIIGLDERANKELSIILSDYAHERWAANRVVNPLLWRCAGAFIDENLYPDMERVAASENHLDREAAVLVFRKSNYLPARELLNKSVLLQSIKDDTSISWEGIAHRSAAAV